MGINLLELLQNQLGGDSTLGMISGFLGEDKQKTGSALTSMLPSLLGGLMSKASTTGGAGQLFDSISNSGFDGTMLTKLGDVFGGGDATSGILNKGGGLLDMVFGNKLGGIVDLISSSSGIGKSSSSSLLKLGLPLVMSLLGKTKKDNNLDASGLASLLMSQKDHIAKAAPAGLSSLLGFADMGDLGADKVEKTYEKVEKTYQTASSNVKETARKVESTVVKEEEASGGFFKKLLPLLLLGLLGLLAWFSLRGCGDDVKNTATNIKDKTVETTKGAANATGNAVKGAANATGNAVNSGIDATKNAASATAGAVKGAANATTDAAKNAVSTTTDAAKNAANATADAAGNAVNATKNAASNAAKATGNAAAAAAGSVTDFFKGGGKAGQSTVLSDVAFDAENNFSGASEASLTTIANLMKANPDMEITIEAFADTGKPLIDKVTGKIRAERIEKKLKDLGVPVSRVRAVGKTGANKVVITQQ